MRTTVRRTGVVVAVAAVALGLPLTGIATADEPGASATRSPATQGPITLSPEQATQICTRRIPVILARIDRAAGRITADASTPGSTAWLEVRLARAEAAGRTPEVDRLRTRLDRRPEQLDRLAEAETRVTAFRDANCAP